MSSPVNESALPFGNSPLYLRQRRQQDVGTIQQGDDTNSEELDQNLCSTSRNKGYMASRSMSDSSRKPSSFVC